MKEKKVKKASKFFKIPVKARWMKPALFQQNNYSFLLINVILLVFKETNKRKSTYIE